MENKIKYLCPHCRTKKGHDDSRHVRVCEIQKKEDPTPDEIFEYISLKQDLCLEFITKKEQN